MAEPYDDDIPLDITQLDAGSFDLRIFDQTTHWVDYHGVTHLIADMSDDYLTNVLAYLEANADRFYAATLTKLTIEALHAVGQGDPDAAQRFVDKARQHTDLTPHEWVTQTPLYLELNLAR